MGSGAGVSEWSAPCGSLLIHGELQAAEGLASRFANLHTDGISATEHYGGAWSSVEYGERQLDSALRSADLDALHRVLHGLDDLSRNLHAFVHGGSRPP